jgi:hypothetical protein
MQQGRLLLLLFAHCGSAGQPDSLQLLNLNSWRSGDFRPAAHVKDS